MNRQFIHDLAKFGAGLVIGDFVCLWWFSVNTNLLPTSFLGIPLTADMIVPSMVIDIFLFILLVHFGWHIGKMPRIKERVYLMIIGVIFAIIAAAHFLRVLWGGDLSIFGWTVPVLFSWIGMFVALYLAAASFHFAATVRASRK